LRIGIPDMISPSYFPVIAAERLGTFAAEGLDARVELVFPVTRTYDQLRSGELDLVVGAAHSVLGSFPGWEGASLVAAVSQHMYWFLVVRADLDAPRGALGAVRGLRIGAAPGPVDGLRQMLSAAGVDPDRDLEIGPVPGSSDAGVSFGVTAADALRRGAIDGFWANGMGCEVAVLDGVGRVLVDARRGDGPPGAADYTFPALVATDARIADDDATVRAAARGLVAAQRLLRDEPGRAEDAARDVFPDRERQLIATLVERDASFYEPAIEPAAVRSLNRFAHELGLLAGPDVAYERVVATELRSEWTP
jgi:ABC-type nitrate/sulfonate/bicarbonate transport system substrate-binding protein